MQHTCIYPLLRSTYQAFVCILLIYSGDATTTYLPNSYPRHLSPWICCAGFPLSLRARTETVLTRSAVLAESQVTTGAARAVAGCPYRAVGTAYMFTSSANPSDTPLGDRALAADEDFCEADRGTRFFQFGIDLFFLAAFARRCMRGGLEAEAGPPLRDSAVGHIGARMTAWIRARDASDAHGEVGKGRCKLSNRRWYVCACVCRGVCVSSVSLVEESGYSLRCARIPAGLGCR